ncbi:MAG: hypothetical protein WD030_09355, partial [Pirellulales bacterium]
SKLIAQARNGGDGAAKAVDILDEFDSESADWLAAHATIEGSWQLRTLVICVSNDTRPADMVYVYPSCYGAETIHATILGGHATDAHVAAMTGIESITFLTIYESKITGACFKGIALPALEVLRVNKSPATDVRIEDLPNLKLLNLASSEATDGTLSRLESSSLGAICVDGAKVTSAGLSALVRLETLHAYVVDISQCDDVLAAAVQANRSITGVDIRCKDQQERQQAEQFGKRLPIWCKVEILGP